MTKRGIILGHTLAFVVLAAVYVLLVAESLVELLMPGYDQVEHLLLVVSLGII